MRLIPTASQLKAIAVSSLLTAALLYFSRHSKCPLLNLVFSLNEKLIEDVLQPVQSTFIVASSMLLGALAVAFALAIDNPVERLRCRAALEKTDEIEKGTDPFTPDRWLNTAEGVWCMLAGMDLLMLKVGVSLNGTVLGVAINALLLNSVGALDLFLSSLALTYFVAIFPNFVKWRVDVILRRKQGASMLFV